MNVTSHFLSVTGSLGSLVSDLQNLSLSSEVDELISLFLTSYIVRCAVQLLFSFCFLLKCKC